MASREEMIAFLQSKTAGQPGAAAAAPPQPSGAPSREQMIAFLESKRAAPIPVPEEQGLGTKALEGIGDVGRAIESYTSAPARAGIGALQDGKPVFSAIKNQFGADPSTAPTGQELVEKAGVSRRPIYDVSDETLELLEAQDPIEGAKMRGWRNMSRSGIAGTALELAADPVNIIPGVAIAKGAEKAGSVLRGAGKAVTRAADAAAPVTRRIGSGLKTAAVKTGNALTGVSEKNIRTYIDQTPEVNKIIAKHGGDMTLAADELRENLQSAIRSKIGSLSAKIKTAIDTAPEGSRASNGAILEALSEVKSGINPKLYPDQVAEIDKLIGDIGGLSSPGTIGASDAMSPKAINEAKRYLQQAAKGSYVKGGQIFTASPEASKAAKAGAREARKAEMNLIPDTAEPNFELARLHRYEQNANKNLIAPGKTEAAILSAGSGQNARNVKNLREIGEATGFDALGEAEKLSAARDFASPSYLPVDQTGKSLTRVAVATGLGSLLGGPIGTIIGLGLTSPVTLKAAINAGKISKAGVLKLAGGATELTDEVLTRAIKAAKTAEGQATVRSLEKGVKEAGQVGLSDVADNPREEKPAPKGETKWASDGLEKLEKHGSVQLTEEQLKDRGIRKLLIEASDYPANSPKLKRIAEQVRNRISGGQN